MKQGTLLLLSFILCAYLLSFWGIRLLMVLESKHYLRQILTDLKKFFHRNTGLKICTKLTFIEDPITSQAFQFTTL